MSDPRQNKRSPDQQFTTIDETLRRCGYLWLCIETYRDNGISGRLLRKRTGFQKMLRDIEIGLITVDLIVVDTLERLGRAEEIAEIRRKLYTDYGVLVVAADNNFADPTGVVGKAVGFVEQVRSTENTRVSRHNVLRGKKDAARLRRWPGGPPPFGYKLRAVVDESVTPPEVYNVLERQPREADALKLSFELAAETGHGTTRMAKWWNDCQDIPNEFKPISPYTIGYRLRNRIYVGELLWGQNQTGVVNDTRVVEPNPDGAEVVEDFCEPLINKELFDRVHVLYEARSEASLKSRREAQGDGPPKLIAPQSRGLSLKYVLSGLARCGHCNSAMRIMPSGRTSKAGTKYNYYFCPRHLDGSCLNRRYVPEDQLRKAVISRLRARLFPSPGDIGHTPDWWPDLLHRVQCELNRHRQQEPDRAALCAHELKELDDKLAGWRLTLGDPKLSPVVRDDITAEYEQAKLRKAMLEQQRANDAALSRYVEQSLDPKRALKALARLHDVLAEHNPTLVNLELSKHIDKIVCYFDGHIELRGTCLGLFCGAVEMLSHEQAAGGVPPADANGFAPVKPRRRGRLRLPNLTAESQEAIPDVETSLDPERFADVPGQFFWTEEFVITEKQCWAEEHAAKVAHERAQGKTMAELAAQFGKTVPTIRHALQCAREAGGNCPELPAKVPRKRWTDDHAAEIARLFALGKSVTELARQFGKSDTTIRAALKAAQGGSGETGDSAA